ncbi:MAG: calcium-translocating P-type ATPase, PMCA-type [Lachnospiraceae bacterium]|nr:calcium-translocating P-type ATPase, PMCA-type [Lachnospiraceae bacterium]
MYTKSVKEVLRITGVNPENGLDSGTYAKQLKKYGPNVLPEAKKESIIKKFFMQLKDFMIYTLIGAAVISYTVSYIDGEPDYIEPSIILLIIVMNGIIGVIQEVRAENSINALKKMCAPTATVLRDGVWAKDSAKNLVPGDIIMLETGALIPADARIIKCENLMTDEASLTGESAPVNKTTQELPSGTPVNDRVNMVYSGCSISYGHGVAVVTATGQSTELGQVASMLINEMTPDTPLTRRLSKTGKILSITALIICIIIFFTGIFKNRPVLEMFMTAVSLAVAAIPEGLPAIVTIMLARGVTKMAAHNAIVKRLPAVETLGSTTVICSDKTGTLTENKMRVISVANYSDILKASEPLYKTTLEYAALCNNSIIQKNGIIGEPTENALLAAAKDITDIDLLKRNYRRIKEFPFTSDRKLMSTIHSNGINDSAFSGGSRNILICKGAPDVLLPLCTHYYDDTSAQKLTSSVRSRIMNLNSGLARQGLRIIAVAYRELHSPKEKNPENNLTFMGLISIVDPPRKEAAAAVRECKKAGIHPVMITGDHAATAAYIARELGIAKSESEVITGDALDKMSETTLAGSVRRYNVYARVTPEHKLRLVKAFQNNGEIVAMTGDGVNDAPALKAADIGCAMGMSGTDVARNSADIVLEDDNFATITSAIREGRTIYDNIKKAIHFLISCNIGEIMTIFMAIILGFTAPLCAVQLLWVNLVTDSFPALSLGVEPPDKNVMNRPPVSPEKGLFADGMAIKILIEGMFIGSISLVAYAFGMKYGPDVAGTMCFAVLGMSQIAHSFNSKSEHSLTKSGIFNNKKLVLSAILCIALQAVVICIPTLNAVFSTVMLTTNQWLTVVILSLLPIPVVELQKAFR